MVPRNTGQITIRQATHMSTPLPLLLLLLYQYTICFSSVVLWVPLTLPVLISVLCHEVIFHSVRWKLYWTLFNDHRQNWTALWQQTALCESKNYNTTSVERCAVFRQYIRLDVRLLPKKTVSFRTAVPVLGTNHSNSKWCIPKTGLRSWKG